MVASVQSLGRAAPSSRSPSSSPNADSSHRPRPVASRLDRYADFAGLVVVDEAHHISEGSTYDTILTRLGLGSVAQQKKAGKDA